jgi:hypothetical protein
VNLLLLFGGTVLIGQKTTVLPRLMVTIPFVCLSEFLSFYDDASDRLGQNGEAHQGGYSTHIRAQEKFVFHIPEQLKSQDAASMYVTASLIEQMRTKRLISGCVVV